MKCQNGEMTCMRLMEIIEQETVSIKWVRQQNEKLRELCYAIEALPASEQQTDISLKASNIAHEMQRVVNFNYTQKGGDETCATTEATSNAPAFRSAQDQTTSTAANAESTVASNAEPNVQSGGISATKARTADEHFGQPEGTLAAYAEAHPDPDKRALEAKFKATGSPPESVIDQLAAAQADSKRLLAALKVLLRTVGALTNRTGATTEVFAAMKQAQVEIAVSDQKEGA